MYGDFVYVHTKIGLLQKMFLITTGPKSLKDSLQNFNSHSTCAGKLTHNPNSLHLYFRQVPRPNHNHSANMN